MSELKEPDQIDMMSEDELRTELRKLVTESINTRAQSAELARLQNESAHHRAMQIQAEQGCERLAGEMARLREAVTMAVEHLRSHEDRIIPFQIYRKLRESLEGKA